jgi:hypothetical protein
MGVVYEAEQVSLRRRVALTHLQHFLPETPPVFAVSPYLPMRVFPIGV